MKRRGWILKGEGIECEEELFRFLSIPALNFTELEYVKVPELLRDPENTLYKKIKINDFVFFPGGFSFADHYGSGRLLSFLLKDKNFFEFLIKNSCHLVGICNGFQVLAQADLFGKELRLLHNQNSKGENLAFRNRWVQTRFTLNDEDSFRLSVRHGEGRVDLGSKKTLESKVSPLFFYDDSRFENGSFQNVAGLVARFGDSRVIGMMPHPEVSYRPIDDPNFGGPDFLSESRSRKHDSNGDGTRFMLKLFDKENI